MRFTHFVALAIVVGGAAGAAPASAATPAQYGKACASAWPAAKSGAAYGRYLSRCVTAATRATDRATNSGDVTSAAANLTRARNACAVQFPPPRNTVVKRRSFAACVAAARSAQVTFAGRPLKATLSGANEVPAAGGATGTASVRLNQGQRRVCFTLTATGLNGSPVSAAHIHRGAAGATGPPVVDLSQVSALDSGAAASGCVTGVDAALIKEIRRAPAKFYVNIHTAEFPGGALRGQLTK